MFARVLRQQARRGARQYSSEAFNNKYGFNMNPPPVHAYWNARNASVLVAFVPVFLGAGALAKYVGFNLPGWDGLLEFSKLEQLPIGKLAFGEPEPYKK